MFKKKSKHKHIKKNKRNKIKKTKKQNGFIDILAEKIPDFLIGKKDSMLKDASAIYSYKESENFVLEIRRKNGKLYLVLLILAGAIVLGSLGATFNNGDSNIDLKRDEYDGNRKNVSAEIEANYKGKVQKKKTEITVLPKGLADDEKKMRIKQTKETLPKIILRDNTSLNSITSDLNLIGYDEETGVEIAWSTDNEEIITEEGMVNSLLAKKGDRVALYAELRIDGNTDKVKFTLTMTEPNSEKDLENAISTSIDNLVDKINNDDKGSNVVLPNETEEGIILRWDKSEEKNFVTQIIILLLLGICIYYNRYHTLNKKIQLTKESVTRDFPDFINKLVLLLNAGMVVTAAFKKITDDYRVRSQESERKYLYEQLCIMEDNMRYANSGFLTELNDIAQRSGIKDVMRFNTIIADNIDKGSALVEKLQSESQILWTGRIKMAEEKGRIAETKLTFPMVLQLLVLIIITIAPAAMEM